MKNCLSRHAILPHDVLFIQPGMLAFCLYSRLALPQTMLLGRIVDMRTAGGHALYLTKFKGNNHWVCVDAITCTLQVTKAPAKIIAIFVQSLRAMAYGHSSGLPP